MIGSYLHVPQALEVLRGRRNMILVVFLILSIIAGGTLLLVFRRGLASADNADRRIAKRADDEVLGPYRRW